jgi:hypothetical protein
VSKNVYFRDGENTLVRVHPEAIFRQDSEDFFQMLKVFQLIFTENEIVVKGNENKRTQTEKSIHHMLKRLGSILYAEWREPEFKKYERCYCFRNICRSMAHDSPNLLQI